MSWYQLISLTIALWAVWDLLPIAYGIMHKQSFTIGWIFRLVFTAILVNLALAFLGKPW